MFVCEPGMNFAVQTNICVVEFHMDRYRRKCDLQIKWDKSIPEDNKFSENDGPTFV